MCVCEREGGIILRSKIAPIIGKTKNSSINNQVIFFIGIYYRIKTLKSILNLTEENFATL